MTKKKTGVDEDGIPFMTDNMKRALDEGKDLPIEQLVSPDGMAQIEAMTNRRKAPVRADTLRPISPAAARTLVTGNDKGQMQPGQMPKLPSTRRVIPAPFQRPRIVVSAAGGHGKEWQTVQASEIAKDDIITDLGRVIETPTYRIRRETIAGIADVAVGEDIIVVGAGGVVAVFDAQDSVAVFR